MLSITTYSLASMGISASGFLICYGRRSAAAWDAGTSLGHGAEHQESRNPLDFTEQIPDLRL